MHGILDMAIQQKTSSLINRARPYIGCRIDNWILYPQSDLLKRQRDRDRQNDNHGIKGFSSCLHISETGPIIKWKFAIPTLQYGRMKPMRNKLQEPHAYVHAHHTQCMWHVNCSITYQTFRRMRYESHRY